MRTAPHTLLASVLLGLAVLVPLARAAAAPLLTEAEEYAVLVAVLFPGASPAAGRASGKGLAGITSSSYNLARLTLAGAQGDRGGEPAMVDDYNRRNQQAHRLDEARFRPLLPEGGRLVLVDGRPGGLDEPGLLAAAGITHLSRPGFNADRSRALVQINHVAGPEMGVGYLVYLAKAAAGGWVITGAVLNRQY